MRFVPTFCPLTDCPAHDGRAPFRFQRRGSYRRKCDGLVVPRFSCGTCGRKFSRQSFRLNYRWWRPHVHHELFRMFVSKVTMRQAARLLGIDRGTVARRQRSLGEACRRFHAAAMAEGQGLAGRFSMDEMETFETDRLLRPVTIPVLIQLQSLFVVHAESAPLPSRGRLDAARQLRKMEYEKRFGKRRSGSRKAVESTLLQLRSAMRETEELHLVTDRKSSYRTLVQQYFRERFGSHVQESSRRKRNRGNPLFAINHTLAMLRDGVSRLVRRNWGVSKLRTRLDPHLWVWIGYRNYVRGIVADVPETTPAMVAGVTRHPLTSSDLFRWRWPGRLPWRRAQRMQPVSLGER